MGFPDSSVGKESACNVGDLGLIPGLGRSPREAKGYTLQYSGLENSMDCIICGVVKSPTRLSNFHFHFSMVTAGSVSDLGGVTSFPDSSVGKESACNAGDPGSIPVSKTCWRRDRLPTPIFLGFPCGSGGKESACNAGDLGSIPGLGRSPGEGNRYPLQYSGLENSMDCIVHGVTKSLIQLSDFSLHSLIRWTLGTMLTGAQEA